MSRSSKTFSFQVKDLGTRKDDSGQEFGQIEAYGAIFNNVDEGRDRILPGAFNRTIKNSKARADARGKKYLAPMLWQHDTHEVIGGWYEMSEDATGLRAKGDISLATQRGREYYALAKAGMTDEFSIIYDVPDGGAKYDKGGVRNLSELRLFSIDPVTFAMNGETFTVNVKAASQDDKDAQAARSKKYGIGIKDGGNVTKPAKFSNVPDDAWADPVNYRYPLHDKGHADNAASRWGDESNREQYTAKEQAIISKRIAAAQAKFGEDDTNDDDDGDGDGDEQKASHRRTMNRKARTAEQVFNTDREAYDVLEDLDDLWCSLRESLLSVLIEGSNSDGDNATAQTSLDWFSGKVMEWLEAAEMQECWGDIADAAEDAQDDATGYAMYGIDTSVRPSYGYYSLPSTALSRKAMLASDATTGGFTADHVSKLQNAASKAMKAVEKHVATLHDAAEQVKSLVDAAGGMSTSGNAAKGADAKAGRTFSAANAQALNDHADALEAAADSHQKAMQRQMKAINSVADDLADVLQGSEAAYGTDRGNAGSEQEGKQSTRTSGRAPFLHGARATRSHGTPPSHEADTVAEDDIEAALAAIRKLRPTA